MLWLKCETAAFEVSDSLVVMPAICSMALWVSDWRATLNSLSSCQPRELSIKWNVASRAGRVTMATNKRTCSFRLQNSKFYTSVARQSSLISPDRVLRAV